MLGENKICKSGFSKENLGEKIIELNNKTIRKIMIPFALVNNKVKGIDDITRFDTPICLECGENLILRNGDKNIKHLAHKSDSKCIYRENINNNYNQETYEHKFAKEYLKDNLNYFREYGYEIVIKDGEFKLGGYRDLKVESIEIEYRGLKKDLNLTRDYIPDILIKTKDKLIALEIYMSNKKDASILKETLKNKNISVYEVDIREIPELNIENIFKNMKLIFSNLKMNFDNCIKIIQNIIIEKEKLLKDIEQQKYNLEIDKSILESELEGLRSENIKLLIENSNLKSQTKEHIVDKSDYEKLKQTNKSLRKIIWEESDKTKELSNEIKYLKEKLKQYESLDIDNLKWQLGMQKNRILLLLDQIDELKSDKVLTSQ